MYSTLVHMVLAGVLTALSVANATAGVIYDATGGVGNGGDALSPGGQILANRFVTTSAATLASVSLNLAMLSELRPVGSFAIELLTDNGSNAPGEMALIATVQDAILGRDFQLFTFSPAQTILLAANTSYYIGVVNFDSDATLGNTLDADVLARDPVMAGGFYYNNSGVQSNAGGPYEISVNVPEPASMALLLAGLLGFTAARRKLAK